MPIYKMKNVKNKYGQQGYHVRINYTDETGKQRQLTRNAYGSQNAKDLERQLIQQMEEGNRGVEQSIANMTVQELFDEFMDTRIGSIRATTRQKNLRDFRLYIAPTMGAVRIHAITARMLQVWKNEVNKKDLVLSTKKHAFSLFRMTLNYAVKMDYIEKNDLIKIGQFTSATFTKPEYDFYTAEEFTSFIDIAKQQAEEKEVKEGDLFEWEYYVFFNIAFYTGMRKGEIHALRWNDIDGEYVNVNSSIAQKVKQDKKDIETDPKTQSSIRTLEMPTPLIEILKQHKKRKQGLKNFSECDMICGSDRSLRDTTLSNRNIEYAELAGLKTIRVHDFRHTHATILANAGINIQEVSRRLGHSQVKMTWDIYSHIYKKEEEKAVGVFNQIA